MLNTENPQLTFGTQHCTEGIRRGGVTLLTRPIHAESKLKQRLAEFQVTQHNPSSHHRA